jgi:3-dehydroquinate dehydratase-2
MSLLVYVLNGSKLTLLRKRQPHTDGHEPLADVQPDYRALAAEPNLEPRFHQSNGEYEILDSIHEARDTAAGVIKPAAFTHPSVAILRAPNAFDAPVIEAHISNVNKRKEFQHHSYVSHRADGVIAGFGAQGYLPALRWVARLIDEAQA